MRGKVTFYFDNNNGVYTIGSGEYLFETYWNRSGNNSIHASGRIGFKDGEHEFPNVEELCTYNYSSACRTIHTGEVVIFENKHRHFAAVKLGEVKSRNHGNPCDEMTFEYRIYGVE